MKLSSTFLLALPLSAMTRAVDAAVVLEGLRGKVALETGGAEPRSATDRLSGPVDPALVTKSQVVCITKWAYQQGQGMYVPNGNAANCAKCMS